jgi:hypothetical protein
MFHLVQDTSELIEGNLLRAKQIRDSWFSMWFNIVALLLVVGSFLYFLYASYGTAPDKSLNTIPFQPVTWMNAVRNVPTTEYGQLPETEIGGGLSGASYRTSAATF